MRLVSGFVEFVVVFLVSISSIEPIVHESSVFLGLALIKYVAIWSSESVFRSVMLMTAKGPSLRIPSPFSTVSPSKLKKEPARRSHLQAKKRRS